MQGSAVVDVGRLQQDLRAQGVKYVFGAYTDVHGVPKSKCVPLEHLADAAAGSELYTVGALDGMGDLGPNEDECAGIPDLDEITVLPWDKRYAVAPANLFFHGEPYPFDFRRLLQNQAADAASLGYRMNMGVEPEVYVLRETGDGVRPWVGEDVLNAPTRGYDLETTILADGFLEPMVEYMNELGWDVYSFDHEGGDGQYEFDFGYTDAVRMADRMLVFRLMAKHVARSLGCFASFMPKPFQDGFGSGAHLNVSLADLQTGKNAFDGGHGGPAGPGAALSPPRQTRPAKPAGSSRQDSAATPPGLTPSPSYPSYALTPSPTADPPSQAAPSPFACAARAPVSGSRSPTTAAPGAALQMTPNADGDPGSSRRSPPARASSLTVPPTIRASELSGSKLPRPDRTIWAALALREGLPPQHSRELRPPGQHSSQIPSIPHTQEAAGRETTTHRHNSPSRFGNS